jgi:hypothetical protein
MKWLAAILLTLFAQTTHAEDRPWSKGVSAEDQKKAFDLFKEGNDEITRSLFPAAVRKYREALKFWDHPAIHFNIAKALRSTEKYLLAYRHFEWSMKFGGSPLDAEQIQQVKTLKDELYQKYLANLSVTLEVEGAALSVNGEEVFKGPGTWTGLVEAGQVTLLATKNGYEPAQIQREIPPGKATAVPITMVAIDLSTRFYREMAVWKPWVVVASGLVGLAGGGVLTWQAGEQYAAYDNSVKKCTNDSKTAIVEGRPELGETFSCVPSATIVDKQSKGDLFSTLSIASYAAGGATLAAGLVLLYINREKPIAERTDDEPAAPSVTLVPMLSPDLGGVNATIRF